MQLIKNEKSEFPDFGNKSGIVSFIICMMINTAKNKCTGDFWSSYVDLQSYICRNYVL